jgi:predicted kinase
MEKITLISISGLPGSGKSTIAEALSKKMKLPIFSVDPIESAILRSGIGKGFETGLAAYLVAETLAAEQLKLGLSVIIDAVNAVTEARLMWSNLAERYQAKLIIVECILEREVHRERIEARVRNLCGLPEVTWEEIENRRRDYAEWKQERLVLDTAKNVEANLEQIMWYIYRDKFQCTFSP